MYLRCRMACWRRAGKAEERRSACNRRWWVCIISLFPCTFPASLPCTLAHVAYYLQHVLCNSSCVYILTYVRLLLFAEHGQKTVLKQQSSSAKTPVKRQSSSAKTPVKRQSSSAKMSPRQHSCVGKMPARQQSSEYIFVWACAKMSRNERCARYVVSCISVLTCG